MGFFDKIKELKEKAAETTSNTTQKIKDNYEKKKVEHAEKKAVAEAYNIEMNEKVTVMAEELKTYLEERFDESKRALFGLLNQEKLLEFTKEFYEKILMPANSVSKSSISMYPHIEEKKIKNIMRNMPKISEDEIIIVHFKDQFNQEFVVTNKNFHFKVAHNDDKKYYAINSISYMDINKLEVVKDEDTYTFNCNDSIVATLRINSVYEQDIITINGYFRCIEEEDFEITNEEIEQIIQEKIGSKIYKQVKKYMVYDDESIIYFAWGVDSITAKDYVVCTTNQIIIMDREVFGAASSVKQFYYEDITSMATAQISIGAAIFKQCDLEINVSGAKQKIHSLTKIEAERVIAIYHQYRKAIKSNNSQPKVIVQENEKKEDTFEQLEKLAKLKEMGIITEEEFNSKKIDLLQKI